MSSGQDQPAQPQTQAPTAQQVAEQVGGRLSGNAGVALSGVADVERARPGDLTFIGSDAYAQHWAASEASAALVLPGLDLQPGPEQALIEVPDVDLAMASAMQLFAPPMPEPAPGVHRSAVVEPSARLGENVRVGPGCVIGSGVQIGPNTVLHANVTVMDQTVIGRDCVLWPGVVVRERCRVGDRCMLHLNVCIGADGFGYRPDPATGQLVKIPQIGTVTLGDDVELGAGTCVDRGKFDATTIGDNTKIDNLVQIGHNCRIGSSVVIAGHTAVAGSVSIGDRTVLGGMVALKDHLRIGAGVRISGGAQLMHDVPDGQTWGGSPARPFRQAAAELQALKRLPGLVKQLRRG